MLSVRKRNIRGRTPTLILTPLLDMFTIILVFLMVSFQAEDKDFVLNSELELPVSSAQSPFKTAVNVAITTEAVVVEGNVVYALSEGGTIPEKDRNSGKIDEIVAAVTAAWEERRSDEREENVVVIQAHKQLPYRTIHLVARSAAHAGFFRFRLVAAKE